MYVCTYVRMYVYTYARVCIYVYMYIVTYVCMFMRMYVHTYVRVCVFMCVRTYVRASVCLYVCVRVLPHGGGVGSTGHLDALQHEVGDESPVLLLRLTQQCHRRVVHLATPTRTRSTQLTTGPVSGSRYMARLRATGVDWGQVTRIIV